MDYYIGALTTFEKLLLLAIMHYLMDRHSMDFQCINDDQLTFLTVVLNEICDVAKSVKVQLPIFQRQAQNCLMQFNTSYQNWTILLSTFNNHELYC